MHTFATADQVRQAEQAWFAARGIDQSTVTPLMRQAAAAVSEVASEMLAESSRPAPHTVVVLAGVGNNAGDALLAAADLENQDVRVLVWAPFDRTHPEGLRAALGRGGLLVSRAEAVTALGEASLVVDGLFGIGGRPGLPESVAEFAGHCVAAGVPVLAVDLPSGLDADRADASSNHLQATRTVTFVAAKPVHVLQPAASRCGDVDLVDIGVAVPAALGRVWDADDVAAVWPCPDVTSDKYSRGVVGLDTGSVLYPGAGVLSALGAVHAGAGMVRCASPDPVPARVVEQLPNVVVGTGRVQAWVCGSGWGEHAGNRDRLATRVADGVPLVVDADAISLLDDQNPLPQGCLLTPHAGELARLLGVERHEVAADPIGHVQRAAERFGATVLLKGATQVVADPGGAVTVAVVGPSWTAQAGSGDVLAGICGTLLAAGLPAADAAAAAASVQAMTARFRPGPWPPQRIAQWLPETIAGLQQSAQSLTAEIRPAQVRADQSRNNDR
ncbi:bifunctional ADP-dependent NAD(P)H-hydrate dehydratase/NAD(P)H-hydrate epimerase [Aestuariimicrobium ganziense]|uniref:bifunctional ADP-dependent NAD(P)H-hydrate dehydratase/NAD(P)H-hydrate epimerase n=1 Tax=Aestuariimicrobium ganziense TaxID=2773677 RepID=UPI001940FB6C|nr:bifunctional ADP-dependent NAD(P)H-hydrate dehydratase/NAD(P)H-hydrate epimerase [Aestuariimicrobium ganziense]